MRDFPTMASALLLIALAVYPVFSAEAGNTQRRGVDPAAHLRAGLPGLGLESDDRLLVALPLVNDGAGAARGVKLTSATLTSSKRLTPAVLPVALGDIAPGGDALFQASFSMGKLRSGSRLRLVVRGSCACKAPGTLTTFSVSKDLIVPMRSGESAALRFTSVKLQLSAGGPGPDIPAAAFVEEGTNEEVRPPIPRGIPRGNLQPSVPQTTVVAGKSAEAASSGVLEQLIRPAHAGDDPVVFVRSTQSASNTGALPDASGASSENVVVHTNNGARRFSTDGGISFGGTLLPPGKLTLDGGADGDHVVVYIPKVDRFVWLMQFNRTVFAGQTPKTASGPNRYRLAIASPQQLISSKGTAWTYFDLTSGLFGFGNDWMDYPDLAVGDSYLYFSANVIGTNAGRLVGRIPLSDLISGGAINIGFTGAPLPMAWASRLAQNVKGTAYLAGHNTDSKLRVYSFPDAAKGYSVHDVPINTWPDTALVSLAPSGINWLGCNCLPGTAIIGAARRARLHCVSAKPVEADELWFAWMAGSGGGFPQPHVQVVRIDAYHYTKLSQEQIWSNTTAFAYPALAVNGRNDVGVGIAFGGDNKQTDANFGVGIYGDGTIYTPPTLANASIARYGDYFTVRRHWPNEGLFSAFGVYYTRNNTNQPTCGTAAQPNCTTNLSYIQFGRKSAVDNEPVVATCSKEEICQCSNTHDDCVRDCEAARDACMKDKPGNPLPMECAQIFKACLRECDATLKLCQGKCSQ